jgi:hypothetical protein
LQKRHIVTCRPNPARRNSGVRSPPSALRPPPSAALRFFRSRLSKILPCFPWAAQRVTLRPAIRGRPDMGWKAHATARAFQPVGLGRAVPSALRSRLSKILRCVPFFRRWFVGPPPVRDGSSPVKSSSGLWAQEGYRGRSEVKPACLGINSARLL